MTRRKEIGGGPLVTPEKCHFTPQVIRVTHDSDVLMKILQEMLCVRTRQSHRLSYFFVDNDLNLDTCSYKLISTSIE